MDLVNAGTANLDLTFLRFAVNMLQNFYPDLPEVIIPFQMPFYFRATWAVIKTWLSPEELSIIKFCGPKEIERFMSLDDVPLHMGGNSRYLYDYSRVGIENPDHLFIRVPTPVDRLALFPCIFFSTSILGKKKISYAHFKFFYQQLHNSHNRYLFFSLVVFNGREMIRD